MHDAGSKVDTAVSFVLKRLSDRKSTSKLRKRNSVSHWRSYNHSSVIEDRYEELRSIARSILDDLGVSSSYSKKRSTYAKSYLGGTLKRRNSNTLRFLGNLTSRLSKISSDLEKKYKTSKNLFDRIISVASKRGIGKAVSTKLREGISERGIVSAMALGVDMKELLHDIELVEKALDRIYQKENNLDSYNSSLISMYLYLVGIITLCKPLFGALTLLRTAHELELDTSDKQTLVDSLYDIIQGAAEANDWIADYFVESDIEYDETLEALSYSASVVIEAVYQIFKALTHVKDPDTIIDGTEWCVDEATVAVGTAVQLYEENKQFLRDFAEEPYIDSFVIEKFKAILKAWKDINKSLEHCIFQ